MATYVAWQRAEVAKRAEMQRADRRAELADTRESTARLRREEQEARQRELAAELHEYRWQKRVESALAEARRTAVAEEAVRLVAADARHAGGSVGASPTRPAWRTTSSAAIDHDRRRAKLQAAADTRASRAEMRALREHQQMLQDQRLAEAAKYATWGPVYGR